MYLSDYLAYKYLELPETVRFSISSLCEFEKAYIKQIGLVDWLESMRSKTISEDAAQEIGRALIKYNYNTRNTLPGEFQQLALLFDMNFESTDVYSRPYWHKVIEMYSWGQVLAQQTQQESP